MTEEDLINNPEYRRARAEWGAYWKRIQDGLRNGVTNDPAVAIARLTQQFGVGAIRTALEEYIENLGGQFEHGEAIERATRRARNPKGAGRKRKRSDDVLMAAWLWVQKCMCTKQLNARNACKLLAKSPTRRGAAQWPGLPLYHDHTNTKASLKSYYAKTPENLRDIYNDAVARYRDGPEGLRRQWRLLLEITAPSREAKSPRR